MSDAFSVAFNFVGGGNAVERKTDRAGHSSSVRASAAVPSSQLCIAIFMSEPVAVIDRPTYTPLR